MGEDEAGSAPVDRAFSARIVNLDYYMASPIVDMDDCYSHFYGRGVMEVPVVRIYGSTPAGQKTCLHLHKAFPYFYVPYDEDLPQELEEALAFLRRFALGLERAMKMASALGAKRQHIHCCSFVRARKFYGYHSSEDTFIKIILYYPQEVNQMAALLQNGGVLDRKFQPYEAHIPYLLQLKIDYNLSGMGFISLSSLKFRSPLPEASKNIASLLKEFVEDHETKSSSSSQALNTELWLASNVASEFIWQENHSQGKEPPPRCSTSELEADASVEAIINRSSLSYTLLSEAEPGRMMVQSLLPIWEERKKEGSGGDIFHHPKRLFAASPRLEPVHREILESICAAADGHEGQISSPSQGPGNREVCSQESDVLSFLLENAQPANLQTREEPREEQGKLEVEELDEEEVQSEQEPKRFTQLDNCWKVADEEAMELLRWMVSSQSSRGEDEPGEDAESEADLCRLVEQDGVESALKKTISTYEMLSQMECQSILECKEAEENEDESSRRRRIPQVDGPCDDEEEKTRSLIKRPASKPQLSWGALPLTLRSCSTSSNSSRGTPEYKLRRSSNSSSQPSVRDLMRMQRGRLKKDPHKEVEKSISSSGKTPGILWKCSYGCLPLAHVNEVNQENDSAGDSSERENEVKLNDFFERENEPKLDENELALKFYREPPSNEDIVASFGSIGMNRVNYPSVFYGSMQEKPVFDDANEECCVPAYYDNDGTILHLLTPAMPPPSAASVSRWLENEDEDSTKLAKQASQPEVRPASPKYDEINLLSSSQISGGASSASFSANSREFSQISGPTLVVSPGNQTGFKDPAGASGASQQVTLMSIEFLAETRGSLRPDPRYDSIFCITVAIQDDRTSWRETIVLLRDESPKKNRLDGVYSAEILCFSTEASLLSFFIRLVRAYDPDILMGWEIQRFSLGFIAERSAHLGLGLLAQISRVPTKAGANEVSNAFQVSSGENGAANPFVNESIIEDEWGRTHGSGIYVTGRTVLNLWRIMRGELKLGNYSIECVAEAVLRKKVPRFSWSNLSSWFSSGAGRERFRCIQYIVDRTNLNLLIVDQLDIVNRTAELARVFGIDFYSVFSRGSQYRVESMMLRLAHSQNFLAVSPSKQQVASQPAMECLPLVMEPESKLYSSPVVVLDFQSLYPSMIIAYNLCFSTCLGKCITANPKVLGVSSLWIPPEALRKLVDQMIVSPNGVMFVPPQVAPGVLPRLLHEILSTRIMVKNEMKKLQPSQRILHRILNAQQFALKLIANVTYGYAAAGFSGRMPCAELADSIVQLGRHTLEKAIEMVNKNSSWGGRVVYGDTDSMFVLLEGRTREEAFRIGKEIASAVTAANPDPVTLKLEKVYHPCVLLTKKRYAGYSYESPSQSTPVFDAKGIETVRRDSCAAVAKAMEKSLRLLFETFDLSKVKLYVQRQWQKIIAGRVSLQDFIFSKEVRLGTYSLKSTVLPPAAIVASKAMAVDPRAEPCYGERVQYVVVHGKPGARLADMVVDPYLLLDDSRGFRLHDTYYISKQILPALQRVFGLVGVDLKLWLAEMPRVYQLHSSKKPRQAYDEGEGSELLRRGRIDHYYVSQHCVVCGEMTPGRKQLACGRCSSDSRLLTLVLRGRASELEKEHRHLQAICNHCGGGNSCGEILCVSLDCSVFFERVKVQREHRNSLALCDW